MKVWVLMHTYKDYQNGGNSTTGYIFSSRQAAEQKLANIKHAWSNTKDDDDDDDDEDDEGTDDTEYYAFIEERELDLDNDMMLHIPRIRG